jgi:hypothetical protein
LGSPIINHKKGHLICSKCDKRGFIKKNYSKSKVQIPNKKNIDTIVKALDYNAKMFFRLYEFSSYLPYDKALEEELNIDKYLKFVSFSPHTTDEIKEFENKLQIFFQKNLKKITIIIFRQMKKVTEQ